jgi:dihydroorotase
MTHVIANNVLTLAQMIERMSVTPARVFNLPGGSLANGAVADVTVIDPGARWTVEPSAFLSKSRNTPFTGWALTGRAALTIVGGAIAWDASAPVAQRAARGPIRTVVSGPAAT